MHKSKPPLTEAQRKEIIPANSISISSQQIVAFIDSGRLLETLQLSTQLFLFPHTLHVLLGKREGDIICVSIVDFVYFCSKNCTLIQTVISCLGLAAVSHSYRLS